MKTVFIGFNTTLVVNILQKDIEENGEPESSVLPYWKCQPYIRFVFACCCFFCLVFSSKRHNISYNISVQYFFRCFLLFKQIINSDTTVIK